MRQVILDTETTGLEPLESHKIIEIGCLEMVNRRLTRNEFHHYLNPGREIDEAAVEIHGITLDTLEDKPQFEELAEELLSFIKGAELIIHNAPFDVAFLNHEFSLAGFGENVIRENCEVLDTLVLARHQHPGQKNSLDALCKRYEVDNSQRQYHGALLDAEILADVYLAMTGGQISLLGESEDLTRTGGMLPGRSNGGDADNGAGAPGSGQGSTPLVRANEQELAEHERWLGLLDQEAPGKVVWRNIKTGE